MPSIIVIYAHGYVPTTILHHWSKFGIIILNNSNKHEIIIEHDQANIDNN